MTPLAMTDVIEGALPPLAGICLTGKISFAKRTELDAMIRRAGGSVHDTILSSTAVLVLGDGIKQWRVSPKEALALSRKKPVISADTFRQILSGKLSWDVAITQHNEAVYAKTVQPRDQSQAAAPQSRKTNLNDVLEHLRQSLKASNCAIEF